MGSATGCFVLLVGVSLSVWGCKELHQAQDLGCDASLLQCFAWKWTMHCQGWEVLHNPLRKEEILWTCPTRVVPAWNTELRKDLSMHQEVCVFLFLSTIKRSVVPSLPLSRFLLMEPAIKAGNLQAMLNFGILSGFKCKCHLLYFHAGARDYQFICFT